MGTGVEERFKSVTFLTNRLSAGLIAAELSIDITLSPRPIFDDSEPVALFPLGLQHG